MPLDVHPITTAATALVNAPALEAAARARPGVVVAWEERGQELMRVADGPPGTASGATGVRLARRSGRLKERRPNLLILDRDGTLIEERHYLSDPDRVALLPGAAAGLREFEKAGFTVIMVTNQSGIARGLVTLEDLAAIHARLERLLAREGVRLDGIYSCPHDGASGCLCRKPGTALVERAASELGVDPARAIVVGDKLADLELGRALGVPTALVTTGYGPRTLTEAAGRADYLVGDLLELARIVRHPAGLPVVRTVP